MTVTPLPRIEPAHPTDGPAMRALVVAQGLPSEGLEDHLATALVARTGERLVGTAALELYADGALLRSVAVAPACRGTGLGRRLTAAALTLARQRGVPAVYLLTTTAAGFFERLGFRPTTRAAVPPSVQASAEFTHLCPASATVMMYPLLDSPATGNHEQTG